jgi:hypothetical protein
MIVLQRLIFAVIIAALVPCGAAAEPDWPGGMKASAERGRLVQKKLLEGATDRLSAQEAFDFTSAAVLESKQRPVAASAVQFGIPASSIGTFNSQTFWIGWNGAFSDSYLPEYENYAWVVYFSPEAVWVALQSAKGVYSGVNVFAGLGTFIGTLMAPGGSLLTKSYLNELLSVTLTVNNGFKPAPYGPLSQLGVGVDRGITFLRRGKVDRLERGFQYNYGMSVSYDLISIPLPGSVSLDTESTVNAGFYPIIAWNISAGERPINAIIPALKALAKGRGSTYIALISKQFAQLLLNFLQPLQASGPVVLQNNVPPTPAQFFNQPLPGQPGASDVNTSIVHHIRAVEQWLESGRTQELPGAFKNGVPGQQAPDGDPWDIFKPVRGATGLAFELGYKHGCDANVNCTTRYADCIKKVSCAVGKKCLITVTAAEAAGLVPGSSAADFEGSSVFFDNSVEDFLTTQQPETARKFSNGKAELEIVQLTPDPQVIGVRLPASNITGNRNIELCRRIIELRATVQLKVVKAAAVRSTRLPAVVKVVRKGSVTDALAVSYRLSGNAKNGVDYARLSGEAIIPAGKSAASIRIRPIAGKKKSPSTTKKAVITLQQNPAYTLAASKAAKTAQITIVDK